MLKSLKTVHEEDSPFWSNSVYTKFAKPQNLQKPLFLTARTEPPIFSVAEEHNVVKCKPTRLIVRLCQVIFKGGPNKHPILDSYPAPVLDS